MDPKLLLVKIITLLYRESQLDNNNSGSAELAQSVIATIRLPESTMDGDSGRETLVGLRATALWMISNPHTQQYERSVLLQRIRVNTGDEVGLYAAFECGMEDLAEQTLIKRQVIEYRMALNQYLKKGKILEVMKAGSTQLMFSPESVDWNNFVKDVMEQLEPLAASGDIKSDPSVIGSIDLDDSAAVEAMMEGMQEELSSDGVIKTGWQAFNRMLGASGGFRRGESVLLGALQHNYKTGWTLSNFRHAAVYNTPYMLDATKVPLLVHISAENELNSNVMQLYKQLKENETREAVDVRSVDVVEASRYVKDRLQANGYKIKMYRVDPSEFGFRNLFDLLLQLEAEGYEIHMLVLDYLNMLSKKGCQQGHAGFEVRDLFRRVRNFTAPRKTTFITPHQLSTEAKGLVRGNIEDFVKEIANKGYYDSCKTIDQEVDLEISIHIEKVNGESYLSVQRGKHRKLEITPIADLYTCLKFEQVGDILDDINGPDLSCKKPGGGAVSGNNAETWF